MTATKYDLAIVGSGIVGLAHAWSAAQRGLKVIVFDRSPEPRGASIRNFGMIWPIGQSPGENYKTALISRERWLTLKANAGLWVNECGSLHLAHHDDEWAVLNEFHQRSSGQGTQCEMFDPEETLKKSPGVQGDQLRGSLWSPTELCVDPREALCRIPQWLAETYQVHFHFQTQIKDIKENTIEASKGHSWQAERILICNGADFQSLYPNFFQDAKLKRCQLQMLATVPQKGSWRIGPHLASGLTLRHYENFKECPSLNAVKKRFQVNSPLFDKYGIHVMASQGSDGSIILGDSHEYDDDIDPFRKSQIDTLIIEEAQRIFQLQDWTIARRWQGIYAKNPEQCYFSQCVHDNVRIFTGLGGAGMTLSFGLAERHWDHWFSESHTFSQDLTTVS